MKTVLVLFLTMTLGSLSSFAQETSTGDAPVEISAGAPGAVIPSVTAPTVDCAALVPALNKELRECSKIDPLTTCIFKAFKGGKTATPSCKQALTESCNTLCIDYGVPTVECSPICD